MDITKLGKFIGALHRRFQIAMTHDLTLPEINASNANFLLFIGEYAPVTAKQIATELAINKGLVSREMTRLEKAGYITRTPDDTDHRTTWIKTTSAGEQACVTIRQIKQALWDQVLGDTSETDLTTVYTHLAAWSEQAKRFDDSK